MLLSVVITTALLYLMITVLSSTAYPDRYTSWFAYLSDLGNCEGLEGLPPFYAAYRYLGDAGVVVLMLALLALVITSLIGNVAGCSAFRSGHDRRFHDVFERADSHMYQRKMQLKGMGAATRD